MSRIGRPKKHGRQTTLDNIFNLSRHDVHVEEDVDFENEEYIEEEGPLEKKGKGVGTKRSFKPAWKLLHKWAYPIIGTNGDERIKCLWCVKFKGDTPFAREGSSTIQLSGLNVHASSEAHKRSIQLSEYESRQPCLPIQKHIELMLDVEKSRIISAMETMYFVAVRDLPLELYKDLCDLHRYKETPNMPLTNEYSSYVNITSGKEFLTAAKEVYWEKLKEEICSSPFYSILVDESTDKTMEQHLIVYITYLMDGGRGSCMTKFIQLLKIKNSTAQSMYEALSGLLSEMKLSKHKMVGFGSDGASSMRGIHEGLAAKLLRDVPHLLCIHCVAHREALAITDASNYFPEFSYIDKLANKIYSWLGKSAKRHGEFKSLLDLFQIDRLQVLQIHQIRWLSRGQVMSRLVKIMPALLQEWKHDDRKMYEMATIFQVQFCIHLLADVLTELNKLSQRFQEEHIDITSIGMQLDVLIDLLRRRFLRNIFGAGSQHVSNFLKKSENGNLDFIDNTGVSHVHSLRFEPLPNSLGFGTMEDCIDLGKAFIQKLVDCLNDRFTDLPVFNAAKLFSPRCYFEEENERDSKTRQWLLRLCEKFDTGNSPIIDTEKCEGEMESFVVTLHRAYPKKNMFGAWEQCRGEPEWCESFPNLMKLWQVVLILPASTASCERGFSKLNRIKNDDRSRLCLETLDTLMFLSLSAPKELHEVDWNAVYETWTKMKLRRPLPLG